MLMVRWRYVSCSASKRRHLQASSLHIIPRHGHKIVSISAISGNHKTRSFWSSRSTSSFTFPPLFFLLRARRNGTFLGPFGAFLHWRRHHCCFDIWGSGELWRCGSSCLWVRNCGSRFSRLGEDEGAGFAHQRVFVHILLTIARGKAVRFCKQLKSLEL